jgi:hypothetical protein
MSDTESDDDPYVNFEPLQQELEDMLEVLNQTIDGLERVKKEVCTPHDLFDELNLKPLLHIHLMNWKAEGRLSPSGSTVCLTEEEAKELRIAFTVEPVSIYTICCAMVDLVLDE